MCLWPLPTSYFGRGYFVESPLEGSTMSKAKRNALLLLCVVCGLILILAMSLPNLVLSPGQPFSLGEQQLQVAGTNGPLPGGDALILLFRGIVALALVALPLYVLYSLLTSKGRQRLIADLIVIGILFLLATYLQKLPPKENTQKQDPISIAGQSTAEPPDLPVSVFVAAPPVWLTPVVILVSSILVVILIFVGIRFFQRTPETEFSLDELAQEAQNAIESLSDGGDLKLTVIHCYREMTRIVKQQKGIERDTAMTVREFEGHLVSRGLPQDATKTLTALFEQVRYGGTLAGAQEETLAVSCLTDIVNACKVIGGRHEVA